MAASKSYSVVILPGDGIGPEVTDQAVRVLQTLSKHTPGLTLDIQSCAFGGAGIDATGDPLPAETLSACEKADAILLGAVGGPKWGVGPVRPEQGILRLRKALGLYANIRPCNFASESLLKYSPLKEDIAKGVNIIVLRELIGGLYFGERQETNSEGVAWDQCIYTVSEVERITRVAAQIAKSTNPPMKVISIDKANVLATSRLWRKTVTELMKEEFPELEVEHQLVDSAAMIMVRNPRSLNGVVVTENMFGDILSDESSVIPGSLGLLPSASLAGAPDPTKSVAGIYEPIHGSAPDIAGKNIANPIGTLLSAAMMLRYSLGHGEQADLIEKAVTKVLDGPELGGYDLRTGDLRGSASTSDIGDKVVEVLEGLLKK